MRVKVTYNDEDYYFSNGKWLTSGNMMAPMGIVPQLNKLLTASESQNNGEKSFEEYKELVDKTKDAENYQLAYMYAKEAIKTLPSWDVQLMLPRFTSICRLLNKPEEAIQVAEEHISKYKKDIESPMLFTSVAAAYCDIGDYVRAKEYANKAYSQKGKGDVELMLVYKRIDAKS